MTCAVVQGNALSLPLLDNSVQCCVTSPPYWGLRDYGVAGQLGLEPTPDAYVASMVAVFREVKRVLRDDGTLWLNLGDSYINNPASAVNRNGLSGSLNNGVADFPCREGTRGDQQRVGIPNGLKVKDLAGIPWRVAFALQADGWYLRSDIIWHKPNPMPASVTDRPTKAHEYLFLLSKQQKYYYDADAIREPHSRLWDETNGGNMGSADGTPYWQGAHNKASRGGTGPSLPHPLGRNRRSVWTVNTQPYREAHFAVMPEKLVEPCVLAGSKPGDLVLDPFAGSGTVGVVCTRFARQFLGVDLNSEYVAMATRRLGNTSPGFAFE